MAIQFNEIDDHYKVSAPAVRTFPASDWVIALWTRIDENPGKAYKYALSNGAWGEAGSIQIYLNEADVGHPNKWSVRVIDDTGKSAFFRSGSSPGADLRDRLVLAQRNMASNRFELWFCEYGGEPILEAEADASSFIASTGSRDLWIGGRADGNSARFFGGALGEIFRGNFALTAEQIKALGMGLPAWALGRQLDFYLPLSDARSVQRDHFGENDAVATKPGINAVHFPLTARSGSVSVKTLPDADLLLDLSNVSTAALPTWDDSEGTAYLEDGDGNKRAVSWSPTGFSVATNGTIGQFDRYPFDNPDPDHSPAKVYYVSDSLGNDSNTGANPTNSPAGTGPKKTLSAVGALSLHPGDEVLFKRGDVWFNQQLRLADNGDDGTALNWIKLGSYSAGVGDETDRPRFDGRVSSGGAPSATYIVEVRRQYYWLNDIDVSYGKLHTHGAVTFRTKRHFYMSDCDVTNCKGDGIHVTGIHASFKNCNVIRNDRWGLRFNHKTGALGISNYIVTDCTIANSASVSASELFAGMQSNDIISNCTIYDQASSDTNFYIGWNNYSTQEMQGQCRVFNCTLFSGAGARSRWTLASKGHGARIYRTKIYDHGSGVVNMNPTQLDPSITYQPRLLSYIHHNVIYRLRDVSDNANGGIVFDYSEQLTNPGGQREKNKYGAIERMEVYSWNNTIDDVARGLYIGTNYVLRTDHVFHAFNNLISNASEYAVKFRDTILDDIDIDYNYYWSNSNGRNQFATDATGSLTDSAWQARSWSPDANSILDGANPLYENATTLTLEDRDYSLKVGSPARSDTPGGFQGWDGVAALTKKVVGGVDVPDDDINGSIGFNFVPQATTPDAGAYQYLSGKTLDFSRYFVGLQCRNNSAKRFRLWRTSKDENNLRALTSA